MSQGTGELVTHKADGWIVLPFVLHDRLDASAPVSLRVNEFASELMNSSGIFQAINKKLASGTGKLEAAGIEPATLWVMRSFGAQPLVTGISVT